MEKTLEVSRTYRNTKLKALLVKEISNVMSVRKLSRVRNNYLSIPKDMKNSLVKNVTVNLTMKAYLKSMHKLFMGV